MNTKEITQENNSENLGMEAVQDDGKIKEKTGRKIEDKLGRVPAEDSDTDEGLGLRKSTSRTKACKTRRARRKAFRPYYQLTEGERDVREERERERVAKLRERMWAKGRIIAPYNTTQFLLADQTEEDFYFSTPADDQDFMSKEFKKDYDVQYYNRLEKMTKEMLLNEYMIIERKNENLEERLEIIKQKGAEENKIQAVTISKQEDVLDKISKFQSEMERLRLENQRLLAENIEMKSMLRNDSEESSSSDSSSSSSSSSESSDEESEEEKEPIRKESNTSEDNGYESTHSKGEAVEC